MNPGIRAVLKLIVGTLVYVLLLLVSASLPLAAGVMLTFPAVNGLALFYDQPRNAPGVARSMLFMPVVNGLLCAFFVFSFWHWSTPNSTIALATFLLIAIVTVWLLLFYLTRQLPGLTEHLQFWYILGCTALFSLLAVWILQRVPHTDAQPTAYLTGSLPHSFGGLLEFLHAKWYRIALFVGVWTGFVLATEYLRLSTTVKGYLGGLPVVPFGVLISVALEQAGSLDTHFRAISGMAGGVLLSPVVPVWFIYAYSQYLSRTTASVLVRFAVLIAAWCVCLASIYVLSAIMLSVST